MFPPSPNLSFPIYSWIQSRVIRESSGVEAIRLWKRNLMSGYCIYRKFFGNLAIAIFPRLKWVLQIPSSHKRSSISWFPGRWSSAYFSAYSNASRNPYPKLKCVRSLSIAFLSAPPHDHVHAQLMISLQSRLVPYFHIDHPNRGPLPGPFRKLPSSRLRVLALDVMATILFPKKGEDPSYDVLRAIGLAVAGDVERGYWSHVSTHFKAF